MDESALIDLHFGLGMAVRNAWLWQGNMALKMDCGKLHPDSASTIIIKALWERLRSQV